MKKNKTIDSDDISAEVRKVFCIMRNGIETVTNMFTKTKMGHNFQRTGKLQLYIQFIRGRGTESNRKL
jgi:hypothetical protein